MALTIETIDGFQLVTNGTQDPVDDLDADGGAMIQHNFKLFWERFGDATADELING